MPKEIPAIIHNRPNYDYHFITKELAEENEGQFECLEKNTEKNMNFALPTKKIENNNTINHRKKLIDSSRFMSSSLSILTDNLGKGLHEYECKDCKIQSQKCFINN